MIYMEHISNKSILGIIRRVFNYVDSRLIDHGLRVSYLVWKMLHPLGTYGGKELRDICFLAILHDIGAYKTDEISRMLIFETDSIREHSVYGYLFLRSFSPLKDMSDAVLLHHVPWNVLRNQDEVSDTIKEIAQAIFLADRIDIALNGNSWEGTMELISAESGSRFSPAAVAMTEKIQLTQPLMEEVKTDEQFYQSLSADQLTQAQITDYLKMIIFSIDFRSRHTVTHTITTSSISYELARIRNMDEAARNKILCGALLHDVGKVGVPVEILEFPGRLSPRAMDIMKKHVEIGDQIFDGEIDESIRRIAIRHHEKLDGSGYPYGLNAEDLTIPERIVAISDIISALSGTRSYKDAFDKNRILSILTDMKAKKLLDSDIIDMSILNYEEIMEHTRILCDPLLVLYNNIQAEYQQLLRTSSTEEMIHAACVNEKRDSGSHIPDLIFPHEIHKCNTVR